MTDGVGSESLKSDDVEASSNVRDLLWLFTIINMYSLGIQIMLMMRVILEY